MIPIQTKNLVSIFGSLEYVINPLTMDVNTLYPPFLLTFEIFNFNVHNCLVYFGASVNIMPLSIAKKINAKWEKTDAQMIHLDNTHVQEIGELRYIIIHLSSNGRVHQCINIVIVDIPES